MMSRVDRIPRIDAYESADSGQKTDGIRLQVLRVSHEEDVNATITHTIRPKTLYVLEEYVGTIECRESP